MTKEEKIKDAYREYWEIVKDHVDENGWFVKDAFQVIDLGYHDISSTIDFVHDSSTNEMIPKEIHGIRDNNGWIKIESESDLPKYNCNVWIMLKNGEIDNQRFLLEYKDFTVHPYKYITHYQEIIKPQPPIY